MVKRLAMLMASLFLLVGGALAQTHVSGTVVGSEDGEPIIGASIIVAGTHTGTVTDVDGHFEFTIPQGASKKLVVSYVGMESQTVQGKENMKIALKSNQHNLDEVMVVAFGTEKKSAFTGSAAVVNSEDLSKKITTNVADALVGSVPGLQIRGASGQPGSSSSSGINIRGISSIYADTEPLIIVDGAPYPGNLSAIPAEDIDQVTVLKDAASAALYGARGASGVIIITTKSGRNQKATVSVDAKWGSNSRAVQDYDVIKDPGQYYEVNYAQLYNRYFYLNGMSAADANSRANSAMLSNLVYNVYSYPESEQLIGMDGKLNPKATLGRVITSNSGAKYYLTPDDWNDEAYKNSFRQEYTVSASGAMDKGSFYASLNYLNDNGVIDNSSYKRYSGRLKADYKIKPWLRVSGNAQFTHSDQESTPFLSYEDLSAANIMYYTANIGPIYPLYVRGEDGAILTDSYGHNRYDYGTANDYGLTRPFLATGNPIGSNLYNVNKTGMNQVVANGAVDINFTDWLKLNLTTSVIYNTFNDHDYTNSFEGPSAGANGKLIKDNTQNLRTNNVQTLTFTKSFGKNNVDALIGHEYYDENVNYLEGDANYEFSPYVQELYAYANRYNNTSYSSKYNVEGFFGRAQYNYDEKYFGSFSYRRDGSSYFAKNNRWGSFWSIGGAWIISKEKWFTAPWVDMLKIKASYGEQGKDNIGQGRYTNLYSLQTSGTTSIVPVYARMGNEDITWEKTGNFNLGLEFNLFKNRLNGTLDYYYKKTTDLLFWLSIPKSAGTSGYYSNIGDLRNSGVELTLTGVILRSKDFDWSVTANLSHNSTKILKLPESSIVDNGGFSASNSLHIFQYWYREGGPMYNAYMPSYAGVNDQGQALYWVDADLDKLANYTPGDRPGKNKSYTTTDYTKATYYEQGSLMPKVFGGFSTSFRWKNFDASLSFDYQIGGKVYDREYQNLMSPSYQGGRNDWGHAIHKDVLKSWTPNNTSSNIPRWFYGDTYTSSLSDRFLTNAGYLNFQSFTVGYTLPKSILPTWLSKVRIYCMGENLCFWSARKGLDPRFSFDGAGETGVYSPTRNISGGVQVTF